MSTAFLRPVPAAAAAVLLLCVAGCGSAPSQTSTDESAGVGSSAPAVPGDVTASPTAAEAPALDGLTIAVDPGHNGGNSSDVSAISSPVPDGRGGTKACNTVGAETDDGYPEHRFTWELAQVLTDRLEDAGAAVVLSRDSDDGVGPCVDERGEFAARADADALISLHANGTEDRGAAGFHVIAGTEGAAADDEAVTASRDIAEALAGALEAAGLERNPAYGEVVERADLATLSNAAMPAVMLEAGEMRNAGDAETLASADGQERIAEAITAALAETLG